MNSVWITVFACAVGHNLQMASVELQQQQSQRTELVEIVCRFMAASGGIQPDDLIVRSDGQELRDFLRVTRHGRPLSSLLLSKRILADRSPLSRLYHRQGGDALRSAAEALGSFAPLDRLASTGAGRKALQVAIDSGSVVELLRMIEVLESQPRPASSLAKIYTTRQLVDELLSLELSE